MDIDDRRVTEPLENEQLCGEGYARLRSGEYPDSVARDLRKQGISDNDLNALFAGAAEKQRRAGYVRAILGGVVAMTTALIVTAARDAGIEIYGPGLAIGLVILANGFLKLRSARDIANAIQTPQTEGR